MPSLRARWTLICLKAVCLAVAVCLIVPALLPAQGTGGRIIGRVADPSGAVLGKVRVTAVNDATGVTRDARHQRERRLRFPDLPVGTYTLSFELTGFKKDLHKSIALDVNQVITLNHDHATGRGARGRRRDIRSAAGRYHKHSTRRSGE